MAERLFFGSMLTVILTLAVPNAWAVEARATNQRSVADNNAQPKKPSKPTARSTKTDHHAELAATQLVESHLPELKSVLEHLRSDDPRQYNLAIRDLAKSARRLEASKNRDHELYDIEVELLQAQSSVRLLTAKLKVRDDQADRVRLREAAGRLHQAELNRAKYELRVLQERIDRTQKSLDAAKQRMSAKQDNYREQLETSYLGFLRKAGRLPDAPSGEKE